MEKNKLDIDKSGTRPFSPFGQRTAIAFAKSPEEALTYLRSHADNKAVDSKFKDLEFDTHGPLNRLIWRDPNNEGDGWHYVDPNFPTGSVKETLADVGEFASDVFPLGFGALGAGLGGALGLPSGPGLIATGVAGASAGAGAGTAINRGIANLIGLNRDDLEENAKEIALATALGGGTELGMTAAKPLFKAGLRKFPEGIKNITDYITNITPMDKLKDKNASNIIETFKNMAFQGDTNNKIMRETKKDAEEAIKIFGRYPVEPSPVPEFVDKGLERIGAPQPENLKKINSKNIIKTFEDMDASLKSSAAPKSQKAMVPSYEKPLTEMGNLEVELKDVFNEELNTFKKNVIEPLYKQIDDEASKITLDENQKMKIITLLNKNTNYNNVTKERLKNVVEEINNAETVGGLLTASRNSLAGAFKANSTDTAIQRELTIMKESFDAGIRDSMKNPSLIEDLDYANALYSQFKNSPDKIDKAIKTGKSKDGLVTSDLLKNVNFKFLETMKANVGPADVGPAFEKTQLAYLKILVKKAEEQIVKKGVVDSDALIKYAKTPIKSEQLRTLLNTYSDDNFNTNITNRFKLRSSINNLVNLLKKADKGEIYKSLPSVVSLAPKTNWAGQGLRTITNVVPVAPILGELAYNPRKLAGRAVAKNLSANLRGKKEDKK